MTAEQGPAAEAAARAVPDELVERANLAAQDAGEDMPTMEAMRAALAAVADDLRAEGRRECAAELRAALGEPANFTATADGDYLKVSLFNDLADSWEEW